jgi:hypothetical protein
MPRPNPIATIKEALERRDAETLAKFGIPLPHMMEKGAQAPYLQMENGTLAPLEVHRQSRSKVIFVMSA